MEKHRETGKNVENTEKQGESRKNVAKHMGTGKNIGESGENTGKQDKT